MIREGDVSGFKWQFCPENLTLNPSQFQRCAEPHTTEMHEMIDSVLRSYVGLEWTPRAILGGEDKLAFVFVNTQKAEVLHLSRNVRSMLAAAHVKREVRIEGRAGAGRGFEIPVIKDPMDEVLKDTGMVAKNVMAGQNVVDTVRLGWLRVPGRVLQLGVGYLSVDLEPVVDR